MGVVHKGRDTKLNRFVALKFLPAEHCAHVELRRRFHQEAQAASALGHPNILAIHDIVEQDGADCIVMELVSGETIEQKLQRGPLRLRDAIHYAVQIADALTAAHRAGVIHRDLKPGNIMVTEDGFAKILDFGLAKLTEIPAPSENDATFTQRVQSEAGAVLGTAAYMSPEQAEARKVDTRTDIFSFGAVLYEMVTGKRAFQGGSRVSTMAAVIRDEPVPLLQLTPNAPRSLDMAVQGCLRKDAARRFQHISDVRMILEKAAEEIDSGTGASSSSLPAAPPPSRRWLWPAAAALLVGAAIGAGVVALRKSPAGGDLPLKRLKRVTYDTLSTSPALSPDGKLVAYESERAENGNFDIWVQQVDGASGVRLTNHPRLDRSPRFSADGSKIYFYSAREPAGIYEVAALGGEARLVVAGAYAASPAPDGNWIAYLREGKLMVRSTAGGEERVLFAGAGYGTIAGLATPIVWSPDCKRLLAPIGGPGTKLQPGLWILSIDGQPPLDTGFGQNLQARKMLTAAQNCLVAWLPSDDLVFCAPAGDSVNLFTIPIAEAASGVPRALTAGAFWNIPASMVGNRLAYAHVQNDQSIWSLPADLNTGVLRGEVHPLLKGGGRHQFPDLTRDGLTMSFIRYASRHELYVRNLATGAERTFTVPPNASHPILSPDGSQIAFVAAGPSGWVLYSIPTGGGEPVKISDNVYGRPRGWSPDGRYLVLWRATPSDAISVFEFKTGQITDIMSSPKRRVGHPRLTRDGRWIVLVDFVGSRRNLLIAPFRGTARIPESEWIPVAQDAGFATWSPDGLSLYYATRSDGSNEPVIMRQKLDAATHRPAGPATTFYTLPPSVRITLSEVITNTPIASHDKLVFVVNDSTSDIWVMDLEPGK